MSSLHMFSAYTPTVLDANTVDNSPGVTVGINWLSEQEGIVRAVRFYLGNRGYDGQQVTGGLFNSDTGALLAQKAFTITAQMAIGWHNIVLDTPLVVHRNQEYISSVYFPCDASTDGKAHYVYTPGFFVNNLAIDVPPLHAHKDMPDRDYRNGLFHYGASALTFPTNSFGGGNYFIDVDFDYYAGMPVFDGEANEWVNHPIKRREGGVWKF